MNFFEKNKHLKEVAVKGEYFREFIRAVRQSWRDVHLFLPLRPKLEYPEIMALSDPRRIMSLGELDREGSILRYAPLIRDFADDLDTEHNGKEGISYETLVGLILPKHQIHYYEHRDTAKTKLGEEYIKNEIASNFVNFFGRSLAVQEGKENDWRDLYKLRLKEAIDKVHASFKRLDKIADEGAVKKEQYVIFAAIQAVLGDIDVQEAERRGSPFLELIKERSWGEEFVSGKSKTKKGLYSILDLAIVKSNNISVDDEDVTNRLRVERNKALKKAREIIGVGISSRSIGL